MLPYCWRHTPIKRPTTRRQTIDCYTVILEGREGDVLKRKYIVGLEWSVMIVSMSDTVCICIHV